jgi:hypothetical protein
MADRAAHASLAVLMVGIGVAVMNPPLMLAGILCFGIVHMPDGRQG